MHPFGQAVKYNIGNVDRGFLALLFTIQDVSEVSFVKEFAGFRSAAPIWLASSWR